MARPSNLGEGAMRTVVNPEVPGSDGTTNYDGFKKVKFDEDTGDVLIEFDFEPEHGAVRYEIQYLDGDEFDDDYYWKNIIQDQWFDKPKGEIVDGTYGVNNRRYYRIVGWDEDGEIVKMPRDRKGTVFAWQKYKIESSHWSVGFLGAPNTDEPYERYYEETEFDWSFSVRCAAYGRHFIPDYDDPTGSWTRSYVTPLYRSSVFADSGGVVVVKYNEWDHPNVGESIYSPYFTGGSIGWSGPLKFDMEPGLIAYETLISRVIRVSTSLVKGGYLGRSDSAYVIHDDDLDSSSSFSVSATGASRFHWDASVFVVRRFANGAVLSPPAVIDSTNNGFHVTPISIPDGNESTLRFEAMLIDSTVYDEQRNVIIFRKADEIPDDAPSESFSIPFSDATGPRYRKVGLNGRPLSDERPQDENETDEAKEETYIDAFNLNLVHSTSDIYVPINGSELTLSLRRNLTGEVFSENSGLRPDEDPTKPFGAAWSSNVASYVRVSTPTGPDIDKYEEPVRAFVSDENGQGFSFVKYDGAWLALPTATHEAKGFMTSLEEGEDYFLFRQKHGNVLRFEKIAATQDVMRDRVEGSRSKEVYSYARLISVTDRLGYQLVYDYAAGGPDGLIPEKIQAYRSGTESALGVAIPGLQIWLRQEDNRVTKAWDPRGNAIEYDYGSVSYMAYDPVGETRVAESAAVLTTVSYADGGSTLYTYDHATEGDYTPKNGVDIGQPGPYLDPTIIDPGDKLYQHIDHEHINLASITNANGNTYSFTYGFDHSRETYVVNGVGEGYFIQTGAPRYVSKVTLPVGESTFVLGNNGEGQRMRIVTSGRGYENVALTGDKTNSVTDAEGFTTTYAFEGLEIEVLKQFSQLHFGERSHTAYKDPRLIYYTTMRITHGSYGSELYTFNPAAGLALSSVTDLSGNVRHYSYEDPANRIAVPAALTTVWPGAYMYYTDPIREEQTVTGVGLVSKQFAYDPEYRKMVSYVDPAGSVTATTLDAMGRRQNVLIYDEEGGSVISRVEYEYHPIWRGFVITETQKKLPGDPSWVLDRVVNYTPDTHGRIAQQTDNPSVDADGSAASALVTGRLYDLNGNLRLVTDPKAQRTGFGYDSRNRLNQVTYHDDSYISYTHDKAGNRVLERNENGNLTGYEYDSLNRRVRVVRDMNGNLGYNATSRTLSGVDADDLVAVTAYNAVGSPVRAEVADGPVTRYVYDGLQRMTEQRQLVAENAGIEADIVTTFAYGVNSGGSVFDVSAFKPTLSVGPRGYRTEVTYDERYQPVVSRAEYTSGQYAQTQTVYDANGNPVSVTDPAGHTTTTVFDALNRPIVTTFADSTEASVSYTGTGLEWKRVDERGNETEMRYDGMGRQIALILPPVGYVDEAGGWQSGGRPTTKTFYDAAGNVSGETNLRGHEWAYSYDVRNRRTHVFAPEVAAIDEAGGLQASAVAVTVSAYDLVGNVVSVTDPRGNIALSEYDAANRLIYAITPSVAYYDGAGAAAVGHMVSRSVYDRAGNAVEVWQGVSSAPSSASANLLRRTALNDYDALGRLLSTTDALGITVTNRYDNDGNLIRVVDGKGQGTTFSYDGLGRNLATSYGDVDTTTLTYDAALLIARVDPSGRSTAYTYDNRNRLKTVAYAGAPNEGRAYSYDASGNILSVTESKDAATDVVYAYDALNRVTSEISAGVAHRYRYDLAGNRREVVYDQGGSESRVLASSYDALNRTATISEAGRTTLYRYDVAGNIRELVQPEGSVIHRAYDAMGRQASIVGPGGNGAELYRIANGYDAFGNLKQIAETYPGGNLTARTVLNTYDAANRLLSESVTWAAGGPQPTLTAYSYDTAHNRTTKVVTVGAAVESSQTYSYNGLNQLIQSRDAVSGSVSRYTYDRNGNRTARSSDSDGNGVLDKAVKYVYDRENRLVQLVESVVVPQTIAIYPGLSDKTYPELRTEAVYYKMQSAQTYRYDYDYRTRRVLRDESAADGVLTRISFSGGTSAREYDDQAAVPSVEYIRGSDYGGGIGGLLYSLRAGEPSFKHYNSRGDVVAATDDSSSLTYQAAYEAFGRHGDTPSSESLGTNPDRQQASTKDQDPTGLLNEGFRYRDLETGTFITRDPLGFVDGPNIYTYVVQNPWTKFDPLGLKTVAEYKSDIAAHEVAREEARKHASEIQAKGAFRDRSPKDNGDLIRARKAIYDHNKAINNARMAIEKIENNARDIKDRLGVHIDPNAIDDEDPHYQSVVTSIMLIDLVPGSSTAYAVNRGDHAGAAKAFATEVAITYLGGKALGRMLPAKSPNIVKNELADVSNLVQPLGLGSTGRTAAMNLKEQLAMKQVMSNPGGGIPLRLPLRDPRWPAGDGWVKMHYNVNGIEVHYVRNLRTGAVDDFKFK